jgi:hypothetical protein
VIRDSATHRAGADYELELSEPVSGLPNDPAEITASALLIDVGAKSPLLTGLVEVDTVLTGPDQPHRDRAPAHRGAVAGQQRPTAGRLPIMEPEASRSRCR